MDRRDVPGRPLRVFAIVALLACALSIAALHYRIHALTVGGRDLGFFMAAYTHLLDAPAWRGLSVHPDGNDAFGFTGLDAYPTLHHDIHLSPLKYALALVHVVTGSWWAVQLVLAGSVLAGLAYAIDRFSRARPEGSLALDLLAPLVLGPAFVFATSHDLRPIVALGGFVSALTAALLTRAPARHVTVIALLGLLVREDAAIVLALAALWLDLDGRPREARTTYAIAAGYTLLFHALYALALPFAYAPHAQTAAVWAAFVLPLAWRAVPEARREGLIRAHVRHRSWTILVLGAPFVAVLADPFFGAHLLRSALERSFPATLVLALAVAHWLSLHATEGARRVGSSLARFAIAPSLVLSLVAIADLHTEAVGQAHVWDLAASLPEGAPVLTDLDHYQAFAGRDAVLVWERLPATIEQPIPAHGRPRPELARAAGERDALWVMGTASFARLVEHLDLAGTDVPVARCGSAPSLVVAHRVAGRMLCPD